MTGSSVCSIRVGSRVKMPGRVFTLLRLSLIVTIQTIWESSGTTPFSTANM